MQSTDQPGGDDVEARVLVVVRDVLALEVTPSLDSALGEDLGVDSLDQLSLIMALEDEFGGSIPEEDTRAVSTLRDIVNVVRCHLAPSQPA